MAEPLTKLCLHGKLHLAVSRYGVCTDCITSSTQSSARPLKAESSDITRAQTRPGHEPDQAGVGLGDKGTLEHEKREKTVGKRWVAAGNHDVGCCCRRLLPWTGGGG